MRTRIRQRLAQARSPQSSQTPTVVAAAPVEPTLTPESREAIASAEREVQRAREELSHGRPSTPTAIPTYWQRRIV